MIPYWTTVVLSNNHSVELIGSYTVLVLVKSIPVVPASPFLYFLRMTLLKTLEFSTTSRFCLFTTHRTFNAIR